MRPFYIEFNEKQQQFHENEEYVDPTIDDWGWKRITEKKQTDSLEFTHFIYFVRTVLFGKERKISQKAIERNKYLFLDRERKTSWKYEPLNSFGNNFTSRTTSETYTSTLVGTMVSRWFLTHCPRNSTFLFVHWISSISSDYL